MMSCMSTGEHVRAEGRGALTMERPRVQNTLNDLETQHFPFPWLQGPRDNLCICTNGRI